MNAHRIWEQQPCSTILYCRGNDITVGKCNGNPMEILWNPHRIHGNAMEILWNPNRFPMEIPWNPQRFPMEFLWKSHRTRMEIQWKSSGNSIEFLWKPYELNTIECWFIVSRYHLVFIYNMAMENELQYLAVIL